MREHPDAPAVAVREGEGFETWPLRRLADEIEAVARGLIALGIDPGDRVGVFAPTSIGWTIVDEAVWAVGAVTVPVYDASTSEQVEHILTDAEVVALVVGSADQRAVYDEVAEQVASCEHVLVLDEGGLDDLAAGGQDVDPDEVVRRTDAVGGDDVATIVYTSGTTGAPKGCVITHHQLTWTVAQVRAALGEVLEGGGSTLLFLPLAHVFARVVQVVCLRTGVLLGIATGMDAVQEELPLLEPTFLLAVPRVFEKVLEGARDQAEGQGRVRLALFDRALAIAEAASREAEDGQVRPATRLQHRLFDRLVYGRLRDALGGEVTHAVSGGSPLSERVAHVFTGLGITVLEGYGLTETTGPITVNRPDARRIGTVGLPLPGVEVRIADDGEIQVRGGNVFAGYLGRDEETAEVLGEDGWYRTEDLGRLDGDGFLSVTGRAKEVLVTAAGKNVAPTATEDRLRGHALVDQAMLVGDDRPFVGALLSLDPDQLRAWAQDHDRDPDDLDALAEDDELAAELQGAVDDANRSVSKAERVREFRVVTDPFTVEGGELTPTMKLKREVIAERHDELIEDIYAGSDRRAAGS